MPPFLRKKRALSLFSSERLLSKKPKTEQDTEQDLLSWIRLSRSENVGPITFLQLLSLHGSAQAALEALPTLARRGGRAEDLRICSVAQAEQEWENTQKAGGLILSLQDPRYPALLKNIHDPPPILTVKGRLDLLSQPALGIVGARNASLNGKKIAQTYGRELGQNGYVVVSGMARGIDTAAHEGSLPFGTVAVLAGGIDYIYPKENEKLYGEIGEKGLIVAESPLGMVPQASAFPRRNRLISGMSQGVVIVEAALKSGSLITAHFALEQGREIFSVPGSPLDPRCHGTNELIRQGAILVQSSQDILCELKNAFKNKFFEDSLQEKPLNVSLPCEETNPQNFHRLLQSARPLILENLSFSPTSVDDLLRVCDVSHGILMTVLLELDLAGRLTRYPGQQVALKEAII